VLLSPRNILYLSTFGNLRWGGQKSLYQLVTHLDRQKFRPYVLLPTEEDFAQLLREKEIPVIILNLPPIRFGTLGKNLGAFRTLLNVLDQFDIALLHTDGPRNTFYAGVAAKLRHLPVVFHVRDANQDRYDTLSYRLSTRIVLVAQALRARFDRITDDDEKFVTIYNGLDLNNFRSQEALAPAERLPGDAVHPVTIVSMGRIEPQKGQKDLVQACSLLVDRIGLRLILAGEIIDKQYAKACEEMARERGMQDRVSFTGYREDVAEILQAADIFALASTGEAFSRAVIEAMAAGRPVVATDVGGTKEAVKDGVTGFIVPLGEPKTMAEKIYVLAADESLRQKFGNEARKRVEDLFTIEGNVQKTERLYEDLLGCG
jgi:glycosyltransferase involved in cell wall biosynthesis